MCNFIPQRWTPATVIETTGILDRSYRVKTTDGGEYIRNRKFIKPRHSSQSHEATTETLSSSRPGQVHDKTSGANQKHVDHKGHMDNDTHTVYISNINSLNSPL